MDIHAFTLPPTSCTGREALSPSPPPRPLSQWRFAWRLVVLPCRAHGSHADKNRYRALPEAEPKPTLPLPSPLPGGRHPATPPVRPTPARDER